MASKNDVLEVAAAVYAEALHQRDRETKRANEAEAENERLRGLNRGLNSLLDGKVDQVADLASENKRLREALEGARGLIADQLEAPEHLATIDAALARSAAAGDQT